MKPAQGKRGRRGSPLPRSRAVRAAQSVVAGIVVFVLAGAMLVPYSCAIRTSFPAQTTCRAVLGKSYSGVGSHQSPAWPLWPLVTTGAIAVAVVAVTYWWVRRTDAAMIAALSPGGDGGRAT